MDSDVADGDDVILGVIKGVDSGVDKPLSLLDVVAALDVILALPPKEIVDGGVADDEDVRLGVPLEVGVSLEVGVPLEVGVSLEVGV